MCDAEVKDGINVISVLEVANILAGMHPRDIKRHGFTITRLLTLFRYLEMKAESMFKYMHTLKERCDKLRKQLMESIAEAQALNTRRAASENGRDERVTRSRCGEDTTAQLTVRLSILAFDFLFLLILRNYGSIALIHSRY